MVRILVVEDDEKVRMSVKVQLSDSYTILEAEDGTDEETLMPLRI